MLTSFFGKSRPAIHFILGIAIAISYIWAVVPSQGLLASIWGLLAHLGLLLLCVFTLLLLDFIIRKNQLSQNNTYAIFFYTSFLAMLPAVFLKWEIILAHLFLLLAFRRIMSLWNDSNAPKKILDAALWISLASLFFFWSILFFVPLWIAVVQKPNFHYKQLFIPLVGFSAVFVLNTAIQLLRTDSFAWMVAWIAPAGFDFSVYNNPWLLVPATLLLTFFVWSGIHGLLRFPLMAPRERAKFRLLLFCAAAALAVAVLVPQKSGAELLFFMPPLAIMMAVYLQNLTERYFKEALLWLAVVAPLIMIFLWKN